MYIIINNYSILEEKYNSVYSYTSIQRTIQEWYKSLLRATQIYHKNLADVEYLMVTTSEE